MPKIYLIIQLIISINDYNLFDWDLNGKFGDFQVAIILVFFFLRFGGNRIAFEFLRRVKIRQKKIYRFRILKIIPYLGLISNVLPGINLKNEMLDIPRYKKKKKKKKISRKNPINLLIRVK